MGLTQFILILHRLPSPPPACSSPPTSACSSAHSITSFACCFWSPNPGFVFSGARAPCYFSPSFCTAQPGARSTSALTWGALLGVAGSPSHTESWLGFFHSLGWIVDWEHWDDWFLSVWPPKCWTCSWILSILICLLVIWYSYSAGPCFHFHPSLWTWTHSLRWRSICSPQRWQFETAPTEFSPWLWRSRWGKFGHGCDRKKGLIWFCW